MAQVDGFDLCDKDDLHMNRRLGVHAIKSAGSLISNGEGWSIDDLKVFVMKTKNRDKKKIISSELERSRCPVNRDCDSLGMHRGSKDLGCRWEMIHQTTADV